jgi:hypothetical protein
MHRFLQLSLVKLKNGHKKKKKMDRKVIQISEILFRMKSD